MTTDGSLPLLSNAGADAVGEPFPWIGGTGQFIGWGNFGAATVKLQFSPDSGVSFLDVGPDTTLTQPGGGLFTLAACLIRAVVVGVAVAANASASRAA